jgi:hypothetical protein
VVDPAHIADTISKTELVRQLKQEKKAAPEMEQRLVQDEVRRKTTDDAERTKETGKSDLLVISEEGKEKNKKKMPKRDRPQDEPDDPGEAETDRHLDIEV